MSDENAVVPNGAQNTPDFTNCPEWGVGGQFTYDPATGLRTRVVPPAENETAVPDAPAVEAPVDQPAPVTTKGKSRA